MKLLSRCPHCHQTESIGAGTDTQASRGCQSCGQRYVPHRHLFVADALTDVTIAVRDDPAPAPQSLRPARTARAAPSPRRPWVWGLVLLLLALALVSQVALHRRDLWAAQWPELRPTLSALCRVAGCRLAPPELIAAVVVVSSGFDQQEAGDFVFSLHLQHDRPHDVATPAVELTLTDAQERAVIRKVLIPDHLGLNRALPPGPGVATETRFSLEPALQSHVHGFRVELFYP
jgi:hypothetical protein